MWFVMSSIRHSFQHVTTAQLALGVSLAVAAWQFVQWRRVGPRVRVRMRPALLSSDSLRTFKESGLTEEQELERGERFSVEAMALTVENRGRTAVTIFDPSVDYGRTRWWRLRYRHTAAWRLLEFNGYTTERRQRLEPFDEQSFLMPMGRVVARTIDEGKRLRVRGSVQVAGRRRAARSPWRLRWKITADQRSIRPWADTDISSVVYRRVAPGLRQGPEARDIAAVMLASRIEEAFKAGQPLNREAIESMLEEPHTGLPEGIEPIMISLDLAWHLHRAGFVDSEGAVTL